MSNKNNLFNIMIFVTSTFVMLLISEFALRLILPVNTGVSFQFRKPHKQFGWVLQPSVSYFNSMDETTVKVAYNSDGWRDTEHVVENNKDRLRVLFLGDSFMEAYSVNIEEALPKKLEQLAYKQALDIETINLGVGGYGTLQEYLVFQAIGKQYKPDIVLLGFYLGNDLRNNSFALESIVNQGNLKINSRPFVDVASLPKWNTTVVDYQGALRRYHEAQNKPGIKGLVNKLKKESVLARLLINVLKKIKTSYVNSNENEDSYTEKRSLAVFGVNSCQEQPEYTEAWNITQTILKRLNGEVEKMGSKLVVFSVPALHEVDPWYIKQAINSASSQHRLCMEKVPGYQRLSIVLTELNIEYVDLLTSFRDVTKTDKVNLFRISDRHWNKQGHALAAEKLYSALLERDLLNSDDEVESVQLVH